MGKRRVETIMYGKFNNRDKNMSLLKANRKGLVVINRSFSDVLKEEMTKEEKNNKKKENKKTEDKMDELFIWQCAFKKINK